MRFSIFTTLAGRRLTHLTRRQPSQCIMAGTMPFLNFIELHLVAGFSFSLESLVFFEIRAQIPGILCHDRDVTLHCAYQGTSISFQLPYICAERVRYPYSSSACITNCKTPPEDLRIAKAWDSRRSKRRRVTWVPTSLGILESFLLTRANNTE